ncbi:MAG: hypothetical protein WCD24_11760 [Serratia inhibens]|uniref:hypothetical protein n=1 Tax=Serratia inhibens TaxID=2338073 RepID=UPI003C7D046E
MARLVQTYLQQAEQDDAIRAIVLSGQAVKAIVRHGLTQYEAPTFDYQQGWVEQARHAATTPF